MKNSILTFLFIFVAIVFSQAQQIEIKKTFGGYKFTQNGVSMNKSDLTSAVAANPEAWKLMKKARSNEKLANTFASLGGFFIGWPIGTALGGGEPNWNLAAIGGGIAAIGLTISVSGNSKAKKAVDLYNAGLEKEVLPKNQPQLEIVTSANGLGLVLSF